MIRITKRCSAAAVVVGSAVLATLAWAAPAQAADQQGSGSAVTAQAGISGDIVLPHLPGTPDDFTWTPLPLGADDFTWTPGPLHNRDDFTWQPGPVGEGTDDFTWQPGPVGER
ncbi:hypothetical protein ACFV16_04070 [Streptomyces massasporeus]|uniref:hypothetical protein n=1 Tax=Streptomyces massasporeus TaxID=67324 RepID=UPI0036CB3185